MNLYKKIALAFCLLTAVPKAFAQDPGATKDLIRQGNAQKTANWQDVLANFFQAAGGNIAGSEKSLDFKSTIFALKAKLDPSMRNDSNYVRQGFARNFQFNVGLKLDSQFRFKGFGFGFNWALINKRDETLMSLAGSLADNLFDQYTV